MWAVGKAMVAGKTFSRSHGCCNARSAEQQPHGTNGVHKVWDVGCEHARILTLVQSCAVAIAHWCSQLVEAVGCVGSLLVDDHATRLPGPTGPARSGTAELVLDVRDGVVAVIGDGQGHARGRGREERRSASECQSGSDAGLLHEALEAQGCN